MGRVTFQALDGLERGQTFRELPTPVKIGREEENDIRLNDERVSRFHAKVQEQEGRYILTDLESTNGTRVNGHPITMHVLQVGDQVHIGRCLLVYGTPEELAERADVTGEGPGRGTVEGIEDRATAQSDEDCPELFRDGAPPLPSRLSGVQAAEMEDVLAYVHTMLLRALYSVQGPQGQTTTEDVVLSARNWHRLQHLQMQLATYLKAIAQPGGE
jgi:hypothetical protein